MWIRDLFHESIAAIKELSVKFRKLACHLLLNMQRLQSCLTVAVLHRITSPHQVHVVLCWEPSPLLAVDDVRDCSSEFLTTRDEDELKLSIRTKMAFSPLQSMRPRIALTTVADRRWLDHVTVVRQCFLCFLHYNALLLATWRFLVAGEKYDLFSVDGRPSLRCVFKGICILCLA